MEFYSSELTHDTGLRIQAETSKVASSKCCSNSIYGGIGFSSLLCVLLGSLYLFFDLIVQSFLYSSLSLTKDGEIFNYWRNPPLSPHLKIVFFNITNPDEFFSGKSKANLSEVGPYVYQIQWKKDNIIFHQNGTLSYTLRKDFKFDVSASVGHHSRDLITIPNIPMLSAMKTLGTNPLSLYLINSLTDSIAITRTPEELIWGYEETLLHLSSFTGNPLPFSKFGFFTDKNNSQTPPTYLMANNGNASLGNIFRYNGRDQLDFWSNTNCNRIQGTDGSLFHPLISKNETLWFFNEQLCRSLPLIYERNVETSSISGFRFVPKSEKSSCSCDNETFCEVGLFDISSCQYGAPIILSWPHFLGANSFRRDSVIGLSPEVNKHGFWFDVQPLTGSTLSAKVRLQINVAVKDYPSVNSTVVPILWFEEGIDELSQPLIDLISTAVHSHTSFKNIIFYSILFFFLLLLLLLLLLLSQRAFLPKKGSQRYYDYDPVRTMHIVRQTLENQKQLSLSSSSFRNTPLSVVNIPMLDSDYVSSSSSSSASHSRNSSNGYNGKQ